MSEQQKEDTVSLRDVTDEGELKEALSVLAGSDPEHCSYTKVSDRLFALHCIALHYHSVFMLRGLQY